MTSRRVWVSGLVVAIGVLLGGTTVAAQTAQYTSRAGKLFYSKPDTGSIARAAAAFQSDMTNIDKLIAYGLAQASMQQYKEAIETFSKGMQIAPNNAMLYRWRGHRYISIGQFDKALADLNKGYAIDSMNYGILYHMGVAHFIRGQYALSMKAFEKAQKIAPEPNEFTGATDWLWMSASRAGKPSVAKQALASLSDTLKITTATAYLARLNVYRGRIRPHEALTPTDTAAVQKATISFGVGNWYLVKGDKEGARTWFKRAVAADGWPGFGFFAAEQELRRLK